MNLENESGNFFESNISLSPGQIKWYPIWYPKGVYSSKKQKTPQEEGL